MNSCGLTFSITAVANAIAKNLSDDEINLLSSVFMQLADTLVTISAERAFCSNDKDEDTTNSVNI